MVDSLATLQGHYQATVLVIDSDKAVREALERQLRLEGYRVLTTGDSLEGLRLANKQRPDLIILDVQLPGQDGFEYCRTLRRQLITPILIVSSRTEPTDKVLALELGADDYLNKPFSWRELLARIHAQLRRTRMTPNLAPPVKITTAASRIANKEATARPGEDASVEIFLSLRLVRKDGRPVALRPKELDLIIFLARYPRQVFTRKELFDQVWFGKSGATIRTVDVHIRWLRFKLEENPLQPQIIQTVYGVGYKLDNTAPGLKISR